MEYCAILKKLREERVSRKISLYVLANHVGLTAQQLSAIERGLTPLKMSCFLSICEYFSISPSRFLEETPSESAISLAKKLERLQARDYLLIANLITLMSLPTNAL
ncbi:MAG: helix-turn-helix transcriptional regulator [Clostridia bacterium]|nr:helix-turn-helix transcriptional regulator [Clostridia bacterium]